MKYYITNGSRYITKKRKDISTTLNRSFATAFDLKTARNILTNNLKHSMQEEFYILTEDEKKIDIFTQEEVDLQMLLMSSNIIKEFLDNIKNIPSLEECLKRKTLLSGELSKVDSELTDIDHWIEKYNPNAGIRCGVFKMQKERLTKRKTIKQNLNYINGLLKCYEENKDISEIKNELESREYKEYIPRTNTWNELNILYGGAVNGQRINND